MSEKKKIVMIDDEQELCFMVKGNLEDTGAFVVVTTSNALEAETLVQREKPDIVLLDVVMPGRRGNEIAISLRKNPETKNIPIVMVSGKGEMIYNKKKDEFKWQPNNPMTKGRGNLPEAKGADALSEAYGVDDYVSKPFTTELLVEVINGVFEKRKKAKQKAEAEEL